MIRGRGQPMIPDNLHIGPIHLHVFGIFVALGFFACLGGRSAASSGAKATIRGWRGRW
jgi:hypothetical protein